MNGCVIPGTGIAVDFWQFRKHTDIRYFFLTHLHGDHVVGLTSSWRHPIYCSPLTAQLLTDRYGLDRTLLRPLEVGQSHLVYGGQQRSFPVGTINTKSCLRTCMDGMNAIVNAATRTVNSTSDGKSKGFKDVAKNESVGDTPKQGRNRQDETVTVTVIGANHCPGAVMFLFEGSFGKILYTGDFRFQPSMIDEDSLLYPHIGSIDRVYLDNTYCSPCCVFPTREEALGEIVRIAREHSDCDIVLGMRGLGKEELIAAVGLALGEWVCVSPQTLSLAIALGLPDIFKTARPDLRVRVVPFHSVSGKCMRDWNKTKRTIAILPTALYEGIAGKPFANQPDVFVVPYSDHSSYTELVEFVSRLRPASVVPVVRGKVRGPFGLDVSDRENMGCFKPFLSTPTARSSISAVRQILNPSSTVPSDSIVSGSFNSLFPDFSHWTSGLNPPVYAGTGTVNSVCGTVNNTNGCMPKRVKSNVVKHSKRKLLQRKNSVAKGVSYLPDKEDSEVGEDREKRRKQGNSEDELCSGHTVRKPKSTPADHKTGGHLCRKTLSRKYGMGAIDAASDDLVWKHSQQEECLINSETACDDEATHSPITYTEDACGVIVVECPGSTNPEMNYQLSVEPQDVSLPRILPVFSAEGHTVVETGRAKMFNPIVHVATVTVNSAGGCMHKGVKPSCRDCNQSVSKEDVSVRTKEQKENEVCRDKACRNFPQSADEGIQHAKLFESLLSKKVSNSKSAFDRSRKLAKTLHDMFGADIAAV